jgi:hypothetical protein
MVIDGGIATGVAGSDLLGAAAIYWALRFTGRFSAVA